MDARSGFCEEDGLDLHIVMLPFLAFGHLNPYLELSKRVAELGRNRISFLTAVPNVARLAHGIPPALTHAITLVPLALPTAGTGLAADVGATCDIKDASHMPKLHEAYGKLAPQVTAFLQQGEEGSSPRHRRRPDWLVYDCFAHWAPACAAAAGVPCVYFGALSAALHGFLGPAASLTNPNDPRRESLHALTKKPDWVFFPTTVAYNTHEAAQVLAVQFSRDAVGMSAAVALGKCVVGADAVALRSCPELEPEWLSLLSLLYNKPVIPLGHFFTSSSSSRRVVGSEELIFDWLADQEPATVAYVALGSELVITKTQVEEIAYGLELSGLPFLWAIRPVLADNLPEGFELRVHRRGLVCRGWVPQGDVLAHASVGGFLTHCGWSSLVEAIHYGVPLALLPFAHDAGINARMVAEKKLGFEVARDEDGLFARHAISHTLMTLIAGEEGVRCRSRAKKMSSIIGVGGKKVQDRYVAQFVEYLQKNKGNISYI